MKRLQERFSAAALTSIPAAIFILAWHFVVNDSPRRQFLFGSPQSVISVAWDELTNGEIFIDLGVTGAETLLGLLVGTALGTAIGLLLFMNRHLGRMAQPYVVVAGSVPVFALAPMLIIWFGTGIWSKVVMAGFSTLLVSLVQAYEGTKSIRAEHLQMAVSMQATRTQILRKIVIPSSLAWVLAGLKLNIGFALIGAFIGEFVSASRGLGHYILRFGGLYDVPRVIFGILLFALLALVLTGLISAGRDLLFPWIKHREKVWEDPL